MEVESQYPIGQAFYTAFSEAAKERALGDLLFLPNALEAAILNLDEAQLQTPYRSGGWTVNQLVHHVADSHMNAYIRFKLCLTEHTPVIKPYEEKLWAELNDIQNVPVNISITLLYALHRRWYEAIKDLEDSAWERAVFHPETQQELSL